MKTSEIKKILDTGLPSGLKRLYPDADGARKRWTKLLTAYDLLFGNGEVSLFSVPGRSEVIGNHTDHNRGCVMAAAINKDIIAAASPTDTGEIRLSSEGYPLDTVKLSLCDDPDNFIDYTSAALIAGVVKGFKDRGYKVGGFDAYSSSDVLKGSGISSSAAYEVMIGNILNHLYNDGKIDNTEIARIAQYAENVYFGKPSGLMDQMACAVGGFVYIDFENEIPEVCAVDFSLSDAGYTLAIINTGGNHADLNEDYASVPLEMHSVASFFGKSYLSEVTEEQILGAVPSLRNAVGDRSVLRALHFVRENTRVVSARDALIVGDLQGFFRVISASGNSSFKYLQNVYTVKNVREQGLSLALALADGYLEGRDGAHRVHGGGFAGTVQVFLRNEELSGLTRLMDGAFGQGATMPLSVRGDGAIKIEIN